MDTSLCCRDIRCLYIKSDVVFSWLMSSDHLTQKLLILGLWIMASCITEVYLEQFNSTCSWKSVPRMKFSLSWKWSRHLLTYSQFLTSRRRCCTSFPPFFSSSLPLTVSPKAWQKALDRGQWQRYHLGISHLFAGSLEFQWLICSSCWIKLSPEFCDIQSR